MHGPLARSASQAADGLLRRRIELKYLLWPHESEAVLSRMRSALRDPRVRSTDGLIRTVYLDRPDGLLTRTASARPLRCVKLRVREYFTPEGESASPSLWIEVKERDGRLSAKRRFRLDRHLAGALLEGALDEEAVLGCQDAWADPGPAVGAWRRLREVSGAGALFPVGAVVYRRLAVERGDPVTRITLDREISYHVDHLDREAPEWEPLGPPALREKASILEVKYRGGGPAAWCGPVPGEAGPVEYSKFGVLSALLASERFAEAATRLPANERKLP
jgi:hypothetical protein